MNYFIAIVLVAAWAATLVAAYARGRIDEFKAISKAELAELVELSE